MVSADNLLSYTDSKINFTVHNDFYDKQLGDVISKNNKHICIILKNTNQYTTWLHYDQQVTSSDSWTPLKITQSPVCLRNERIFR